ncbi:GNAT family N-acetyltransferase [Occultella gossypii]|uniref:GNAT family N-acetyltransferase n=1 Tax=Occultella gossypii TaxID=2800820 RepID=A0ABS7S654_9MICO|nr:GNAT family protein [Occultella gossypii]MBZ2195828.1 GNAT family N-acetyltransferase [Occultella gossypii]
MPEVEWAVPTLPGEMVTLRPIEATDADDLWLGVSDPEGRRQTGETTVRTREEVAEWAATAAELEGRFDWAMCTEDRRMVGEIALERVDLTSRRAEVRLLTNPGHRGRGYGREAIMLVLAFAFEASDAGGLGLHRVGLEVLSINPRAAALYQSLGFVVEGRIREAYLDSERYYDSIRMGMLEDEYAGARASWR